MCGFIAVFNRNTQISDKTRMSLRAAGASLKHRGPDDSGEYFDGFFGAFFNRLSILDLSKAGHQPMISNNSRFILVFNGEIYNYKEIKKNLGRQGIQFQTQSDTEVLLKLFEKEGIDSIKKLRGMFSIVIWDKKLKRLIIARDRFGIKPLYYFYEKNQVVVASEIKAILALLPQTKKENKTTVFKYLTRNWLDDTSSTFFNDIKSVKPAHILIFTYRSHMSVNYWRLNTGDSQTFNPEEFREKFYESVNYHLNSDVPVAATLSGGLDSTSIVAAARELQKKQVCMKTFSVIPTETYDERPWIKKMVRQFGTDQKFIKLSYQEIPHVISDILKYHDEPFQGSSCVYQFLLRREISKQGIKVLLVGEGGDEVLGGYRRLFYPFLLSLQEAGKNREWHNAIENAGPFMEETPKKILMKLRQYKSMILSGDDGQENKAAYDLINKKTLIQFSKIIRAPSYPQKNRYVENNFMNNLYHHIFCRDLPYVLRTEDRNSMAFGIEARVPFLDHIFVENIFKYNFDEFMRGGVNKSMLRRAMKKKLPKAIINRKSKSPRPGNNSHLIYEILYKEMKNLLRDSSKESNFFFNKNHLQMFENDKNINKQNRADAWLRIFLYRKWYEANIS